MIRYYFPVSKKHDPFSDHITNYYSPYMFHACDDCLEVVYVVKFLFGYKFKREHGKGFEGFNRISFE